MFGQALTASIETKGHAPGDTETKPNVKRGQAIIYLKSLHSHNAYVCIKISSQEKEVSFQALE